MDIEERLLHVLEEQCGEEKMKNMGDDLQEIGFNSFTFIKLIVEIEDEFDIEFDDEDLAQNNFLSFQVLLEYVKSKL